MKLSYHIAIISFAAITNTCFALDKPAAASSGKPVSDKTQLLNCQPIKGLDSLLSRRHLLLLGETHGTNESPAFVYDTVCNALKKHYSVSVGLEIHRQDQRLLNTYLQSDGTLNDKLRLLQGTIWRSKDQYGISSTAMLSLIDKLRQLIRHGYNIRVLYIDDKASLRARDHNMAQVMLQQMSKRPNDFMVVLTGSTHTRITKGLMEDVEYEPMGYQLRKRAHTMNYKVISLKMRSNGGSHWSCFAENGNYNCGVHKCRQLQGKGLKEVVMFGNGGPKANKAYHGEFHLGSVSASQPARTSIDSSTGPVNPNVHHGQNDAESGKAQQPPVQNTSVKKK